MKTTHIKILVALALMFTAASTMQARGPLHQPAESEQSQQKQHQKIDREQWFKEAREMKHQFLVKELDLSKEQQKTFFELYDRMEDDTRKLQRETRQMEKNVRSLGDNATTLDYERATDALFDAKQREGAIEVKYKEEFRKILTPRQLFLLKGAERKFTKQLMERHQQLRK